MIFLIRQFENEHDNKHVLDSLSELYIGWISNVSY